MIGKKLMNGREIKCCRNKNRWIRALFAVALAALLLTAVSCAPATRSANDQKVVSIRLAIARPEGSLNPYTYVSGYPGHNLLLLVYDTLFQLDEQNVPRPWLVKSYQQDADGLIWSFTLHDGITWHDGAPLTAKDVQFSYEYYREHNHSRWTRAVAAVESIAVHDELNFTMRLNAPAPGFLVRPLADVPIIPAHIWRNVKDPENFTDNTGSGPFRVAGYEPDISYRLKANTAYFLGKPSVDEIGIVIIEDQTATFTALRTGEIDIASRSLPPELIEVFYGYADVEVVTGPGFAGTLLQINNEREPFDDYRVRLAIARAIDLDDLVETVLLGYGAAGNPGFLHPALPGYKAGLKQRTDLSRARALLDEAGFAGSFGDKEFELLVRSNDPLRLRTAEIIAESLAVIGMNVKVKALDPSSVDSLVWPEFDVTKGRNYDLAIWGWSAPVMLDPVRVGALFHSDLTTKGALNIGAYASGPVDAIVEELVVTVDPDRQAALLADLQKAVAETAPFVTLFYPDGIFAYRPEAYDGWVFQDGQGILNKLSFVTIP